MTEQLTHCVEKLMSIAASLAEPRPVTAEDGEPVVGWRDRQRRWTCGRLEATCPRQAEKHLTWKRQ